MKTPPITNSEVGRKLVNIFARGAISLCKKNAGTFPLPRTIEDFKSGLLSYSRVTGLQAGIAFLADKQAHRDFYELLGVNPDHAGKPYAELFELAEHDESLARGLQLVFAFATAKDPSDSELVLKRNAKVFREIGGPELEAIAVAFENGDCQFELVFEEMQRLLTK